jgi:hypothetical protein
MTKLRNPLTFELALTRVAGLIGWEKVAELAGHRDPRAVRRWSDPDDAPSAENAIGLGLALKLDVAYQEAGGDGAPMWQCYSTRLETDTRDAFFSTEKLVAAAATAARESGEAIEATIMAARPGASRNERARAELQIEESIAAQMTTLAHLRGGCGEGVEAGT